MLSLNQSKLFSIVLHAIERIFSFDLHSKISPSLQKLSFSLKQGEMTSINNEVLKIQFQLVYQTLDHLMRHD